MRSTCRRSAFALAALLATAQSPAPAPWCTTVPLPDPHGASCRALELRAPRELLHLAVVTTEPLRERGLMHVRVVPAGEGMLFAFADGDHTRAFWMKDTIAPLDMIFVRGDGTVSTIAANVPATKPGTPDRALRTYDGIATYVIELAAGGAARAGIATGTKFAIPEIPAQ